MSKIDKNVQPAREWLKKHAEAPEAAALQKALAAWEAKVKLVDVAKKEVEAAKNAAILARKEVTLALATAKVARKVASKDKKPAPVTAAPAAKAAPVKKAAPAKKAVPAKKAAPKKVEPQS